MKKTAAYYKMRNEKNKYYYTYCTINTINNKVYVGYHSTYNLDDGYIGCGVTSQAYAKSSSKYGLKSAFIDAVNKYGYDMFDTVILDFYPNVKAAKQAEKELVDIDFINRSDTYNISLGGAGGGKPKNHKHNALHPRLDEIKQTVSESSTLREAAKTLDINYHTLRTFCRIHLPNVKCIPTTLVKHSKNIKAIIKGYETGRSLADLSKEFNCGWKALKTILKGVKVISKKYVGIDPDKRVVYFNTARELGASELYHSGVILCAKGLISNYKGWLFFYADKWDGRTEIVPPSPPSTNSRGVQFITPTGDILTVKDNLVSFCKHHGLCYGAMLQLKNGSLSSHKKIKLYER